MEPIKNSEVLEKVIEYFEGENKDIIEITKAIKSLRDIFKKDIIEYSLYHNLAINFIPFYLCDYIEQVNDMTLVNDIYTLYIHFIDKKVMIRNDKTRIEITIYFEKEINDNIYEFIVDFYDKPIKVDIQELNKNNIKYESNNEVHYFD
jgi:hypothetical protein